MRYFQTALLVSVLSVGGTACVSIDTGGDFDRFQSHALEATRAERVYRPDGVGLTDAQIEAMAADGLSLDDAVSISLLRNAELQAAAMRIGIARADLAQAQLLSNPTLGLSVRFPAGGGRSAIDAGIAQSLVEIWELPVRVRAADHELTRTILQLAQDASSLSGRTRAAYFDCFGAEAALAVSVHSVETAGRLMTAVEARREAGAVGEIDVNLARGLVVDATLEAAESRLAVTEARLRLAQLMGMHRDSGWALSDELPSAALEQFADDAWVMTALGNRLDVRAAAYAVAIAESQLALERRRLFPVVELGLAYEREARGRGGDRNFLAETARASASSGSLTLPDLSTDADGSSDSVHTTGPSLSVELPLFDQHQASIARAQYAAEESRRAEAALLIEVAIAARSAAARARTASEVSELLIAQALPVTSRNADLARESYELGRASFLTVLEAQRAHLATERRAVEAATTAAVRVAELENVLGKRLVISAAEGD
jgi:cobalt-zinc-cadmium efflux system outer membrane protein